MRPAIRALTVVGIWALGGACALACTIVNGLTLPVDAGPDVVDTGPPDAGDPCPHALPPPAPSTFAGGDENEFVVAVREMNVGIHDSTPMGFDLDGMCSCAGGVKSSCVPRREQCDDPTGRDNNGKELFLALTPYVDVEVYVNDLIRRGRTGLLLRVQNYNGKPDDSDITLSAYLSDGIYGPPVDGGTEPTKVPAKFDATDHWTIDVDQLLGPPEARFSKDTATGYVSGGTLVARIDARIRFLEGATTTLKGGVITARISTTGSGQPTITAGVMAGRLPTSEALRALSWSREPTSGKPFCELEGFEGIAKAAICGAADLTVDATQDRTGAACEAISSAISFTAVPASFGDAVVVDQGPPRCVDAGSLSCD